VIARVIVRRAETLIPAMIHGCMQVNFRAFRPSEAYLRPSEAVSGLPRKVTCLDSLVMYYAMGARRTLLMGSVPRLQTERRPQ